jgi:hypothetical protein
MHSWFISQSWICIWHYQCIFSLWNNNFWHIWYNLSVSKTARGPTVAIAKLIISSFDSMNWQMKKQVLDERKWNNFSQQQEQHFFCRQLSAWFLTLGHLKLTLARLSNLEGLKTLEHFETRFKTLARLLRDRESRKPLQSIDDCLLLLRAPLLAGWLPVRWPLSHSLLPYSFIWALAALG